MENTGDWKQKPLISELTQGRELVKQLRTQLNPSSCNEMRDLLVGKILSSFEKSLSMLQMGTIVGVSEFPSGRRRTEDSGRGAISKKRKILPQWTEHISISSGTGLEGPPDDGYSWRKYGQKDILGAKYPRGYYRCTHRNVQGCLATKQVQKSDEDPSILDITYRGNHTCHQASHLIPAMGSWEKQEPNQNQYHLQQQQQSQEIFFNFQTGVEVKTKDLDTWEIVTSSLSLPSTSIGCMKTENHVFSPSTLDNNLMGSFSPSFISPTTSESNYFSVSPCRMNSFGGDQNFQTLESDFTEIISAATSATNSPIGGLDFYLDHVEFDPNFPFNTPDLFS